MKNLKNNKSSSKLRLIGYLTVFGCLFFGSLQAVRAQEVTFAQFNQRSPSQQAFVFTNNTINANFNTIAGGVRVRFFYDDLIISGLDPSLIDEQDARLFLTSGTNAPAILTGSDVDQPLNQINTIQIIRATPAPVGNGSRTNLLTITFSPIGADAPSLTGQGGQVGFGATSTNHTVTFTSDFLSFSNSTERNFSVGLSSVNPNLSVGIGGFLNNFAASGTGTFASNPAPIVASPTAAAVSIGGRVLTASGRGVRGAQVTLTDSNGSTRTVITGTFGHYNFTNLSAGQTVIISVRSKRNQFAPRVITLSDDLSEVDFIAEQ